MKKIIKNLILILVCVISLFGCDSITNNEIHNKSYNVDINITEVENAIEAAIEKASPAVIGVSNYTKTFTTYELAGVGSGVIYSCKANMKDGTQASCDSTLNSDDVKSYDYLLVTNKHVIEGASKVKVFFGEEMQEIDAKIKQYDDKVDLGVLSFTHTKYIQPLEFADSEELNRGSIIIAIGSPSGYDFYGSATMGIVSYPKRYITEDTNSDNIDDWDAEYIQHDAAINPGNSGGPIVNLAGQVVGINTLKFVEDEIDNMGFAIPSNLVKQLIPSLEEGLKPTRITFGVTVISIVDILAREDDSYNIPNEVKYGMYVVEVSNNSSAYNAGIKSGDIIVKFNGVDIKYLGQFRAELGKIVANSGYTAEIEFYRNGTLIKKNITF